MSELKKHCFKSVVYRQMRDIFKNILKLYLTFELAIDSDTYDKTRPGIPPSSGQTT